MGSDDLATFVFSKILEREKLDSARETLGELGHVTLPVGDVEVNASLSEYAPCFAHY